ncbi:MAG: hypothetical protein EZS28_033392 [Streblomastix strix]|uniref:Uncharacterized protein n=1 Tax=Streblomastix strix TaxID=222440 RepID=A0A5J4ULD2_9EUKA|nr:MAG: hypothetical protein EZS28_033392 [Streblomastix strix]
MRVIKLQPMEYPNILTETGYTLFSIVDDAIKPKFSGTQDNIPLNAVMFAQKVYGYPIDWTGAIAIDCHINPLGQVKINTMCQIHLLDDFCVQVCDSYAIYNQSSQVNRVPQFITNLFIIN